MNATALPFLTLPSTCAQETDSLSFTPFPVLLHFFSQHFNSILVTTSPLRRLIVFAILTWLVSKLFLKEQAPERISSRVIFTRKPCPTLHRFGKIKSILSKLLLVVVFIPATESKPGQAYTYPPCGYSINCRGSCLHRPSEAQAETFVSTHLDVYLSFCKHVYASYNSLKCYVNKLGKWQIKNYFSYENEVIVSVNNDYVWDCWKMLLLILRC